MKPWKLSGAYGWTFYIGDGVQPAAGTRGDTAEVAVNSASTWYHQKSPCTTGDFTYVPEIRYGGWDERESDFDIASNGESTCGEPDQASTIDAGNLNPSRTVARSCVWERYQAGTDTVRTADIRFNTTDKDFTYTPGADACTSDWDVQSVLTHEMGHVVGLADVDSASGVYQTMTGAGDPCRSFMRTLGKGDVNGLLQQY